MFYLAGAFKLQTTDPSCRSIGERGDLMRVCFKNGEDRLLTGSIDEIFTSEICQNHDHI